MSEEKPQTSVKFTAADSPSVYIIQHVYNTLFHFDGVDESEQVRLVFLLINLHRNSTDVYP